MNSYTDYEAQHWDSRIITVTTWYSWLLTKDSLLSLSIITVLFCQTLVVHSLYIAGDRTKMVGNRSPRQVLSVYQKLRPPDGGEGTSSPPAARAGPGRPTLLHKRICAALNCCTPWRAPIFARCGKSHDLPRWAFFIYRSGHFCPPW